MKKTIKILGIIAFIAVIGFSMTACPPEADNPAKPEKYITVTGIPPNYTNMIGALKLYPIGNPSVVTVYSTEEIISGTSVILPLFNWAKEDPWLGSGSYNITIFIFKDKKEATAGQYRYKGVVENTAITETTTIIDWSLFSSRP